MGIVLTTNDLAGCPKSGLLSGIDGRNKLSGAEGDDEAQRCVSSALLCCVALLLCCFVPRADERRATAARTLP